MSKMDPLKMKEDEKALLLEIARLSEWENNISGRAFDPYMASKRNAYIIEKFSDWGWFESGVSTRTGWLTVDGIAAAEKLSTQPKSPIYSTNGIRRIADEACGGEG